MSKSLSSGSKDLDLSAGFGSVANQFMGHMKVTYRYSQKKKKMYTQYCISFIRMKRFWMQGRFQESYGPQYVTQIYCER
jgi:hypothetical protein